MEYNEATIMQNLIVVGTLQVHDKLHTAQSEYYVGDPSKYRGLLRLLKREDRYNNASRIDDVLKSAMQLTARSLEDLTRLRQETRKATGLLPHEALRIDMAVRRHDRFIRALENVPAGLANLKQTYANDSNLIGKLTKMDAEIKDFLAGVRPLTTNAIVAPSCSDGGSDCDGFTCECRSLMRPNENRTRATERP